MSKRERVEDAPVLSNLNKKTRSLTDDCDDSDLSDKENMPGEDNFETDTRGHHMKRCEAFDFDSPSQIDLNVKNLAENFEQIFKHSGERKSSSAQKGKWVDDEAPTVSGRVGSILKEHCESTAKIETSPVNRSLEKINVNVRSLARKFCSDKSKETSDKLSVSSGYGISRTPGRKPPTIYQECSTPMVSKFKRLESIATPSQLFKSKLYGRKGLRSDFKGNDRLKTLNKSASVASEVTLSPQKNPVKICVDISNLREVFERKAPSKKDIEQNNSEEILKEQEKTSDVMARTKINTIQGSDATFEKEYLTEKDILEKDMVENEKEPAGNFYAEARSEMAESQLDDEEQKNSIEGETVKENTIQSKDTEADINIEVKIFQDEDAFNLDTDAKVYVSQRWDELFQSHTTDKVREEEAELNDESQDNVIDDETETQTEVIHVYKDVESEEEDTEAKKTGQVPKIEVDVSVSHQKVQKALRLEVEKSGLEDKSLSAPLTPVILITNAIGECIDRIEGQELIKENAENADCNIEIKENDGKGPGNEECKDTDLPGENDDDIGDVISHVTMRKKSTTKSKKQSAISIIEESQDDPTEDCISVSEGRLVFEKSSISESGSEARVEKKHIIAPRLAEKLSRLSKNLESLGEFPGGTNPISNASCTEAPSDVKAIEGSDNILQEEVFLSPERMKSLQQADRKAVSPRVLKRCMDNSDLCSDNIQVFDATGKFDSLRSFDENGCPTDKESKDEQSELQIRSSTRGYTLNSTSKFGNSIEGEFPDEYATVSPGKKQCLWNIKESTPVVNKRDIKFSVNLDSITRASKLEISCQPSYGDSAKLASDFSLPGEFSSCKGEISHLPGLTSIGSTVDSSGLDKITSIVTKKIRYRASSCDRNIKYFAQKKVKEQARKGNLDEAFQYNKNILEVQGDCSFDDLYKEASLTLNLKDKKKSEGDSGVSDLDLSFEEMVEVNKDVLWRYHTQPVESTQDEPTTAENEPDDTSSDVDTRRLKRVVSRHHTQPITPTEREAVESMTDEKPENMSGSIADRLSSLQQHGENEWRKRVQRDSPSPSTSDSNSPSRLRDRQSQLIHKVTEVKMRDKAASLRSQERPVSLADRLSCLEDAQSGWRKRVEDKDASKFTVEGKMSGKAAASPLVDKRHTRANLNRELDSVLANGLATPTRKRMTIPAEVTLPSTPQTQLYKDKESASTPNIPVSTKIVTESQQITTDSDENKENAVVEVHRADDEAFQSFYAQNVTGSGSKRPAMDVSIEDMDNVTSHQILSQTKRARPQNRQARSSKNPLKALAQRDDLKTEYEEYSTGVAEKELRRIKTDQIAGKACMATDALAALATKENFDQVKLRKAEAAATGSHLTGGDRFLPYKEVMLLQVKGRRCCQCRLVAPAANSINSGDCFILVTPKKVYVWIGDYCNVIEKSKAMDVAQTIQQKKDLGCKSPADPCVLYEGKDYLSGGEEFWRLLGGRGKPQAPGPAEEDELYEMYLAETNMVYRVQGEHLVAQKDQWGQVLRHEILTDKQAFVFDFGSEVYVWTGKNVAVSERRVAMKLATEIWCRGYDYSNCDINPLSPLHTEEKGGLPLKSSSRPEWALLGKVNMNMETILFKEKFSDWPDSSSKIIKMKDADQEGKYEFVELKACEVEDMLQTDSLPVDLILEGSHIGRGDKWVETEDGIRREFGVVTIDIAVWHVLQYEHFLLEEQSYGQFHDADTFVVRWHYKITQSGIKTLKGKEAAHSQTGREKCAYFFWQGHNSSITEKGASALMTVELDQERGPQVRVVQGKEPPCFIRLFGGRMAVHIGKREEEETNTQGDWKLYLVRNEIDKEAYLLEVPPSVQNLRSCSSFILLNVQDGQMFIWHGAKSSQQTRARARECADNMTKQPALEFGVSERAVPLITEMDEGSETSRLRRALGGGAAWRAEPKPFHSLLKVKHSISTPRLFHMTSVSGTFVAKEIQNLTRCDSVVSVFPFIQSDLYKAPQPALFLLDAGHMVYLWQGWWPEETEDLENVRTGSAESRLNSEKIVAMETCLNYCKAKSSGRSCPSYLVFGGLEPTQFTNLFPTWEVQEDVKSSQLLEGRSYGESVEISGYLHKLTQTRYTYAELQERPLPEGVDPLKMEKYLHDDQFEVVLETSREEFYNLPPWKQINLKKEKGLF